MSKIDKEPDDPKLKAKYFLQKNEKLWSDGRKPSLLDNVKFLSWCQQLRYFQIHKPKLTKLDELEKFTSQVSNKKFIYYQSAQEYSCVLKFYQVVLVQSYQDYLKIKKEKLIMDDYFNDSSTKAKYQDEKQFLKIKKKWELFYFGASYQWMFKQSTCRIIVVSDDQDHKDYNYFIYHKSFQKKQNSQRIPLKVQQSGSKMQYANTQLAYMVEIIKVHCLISKHEGAILKIKSDFRKSIGSSIYNSFKKELKLIQQQKNKHKSNIVLRQSFEKYHLINTNSFIQQWRKKSKKSQLNLFLQVFSILVSKQSIPKSVKLTMKIKNACQKETNKFDQQFKYNSFENDHFVYKLSDQQNFEKFFKLDIQKDNLCKKVEFQVEIQTNDKNLKYSANYLTFKEQNKLFIQEIVLQKHIDGGQNRIIDPSSYCVICLYELRSKSQKMTSLLQFYQSSLFKNIGVVPSKFFDCYRVNYNPETFKIVRALIGNQNIPTKISRGAYQKTYYELVNWSQRQENKSQRIILLTPQNKRKNKFLMNNRFWLYLNKLFQNLKKVYNQQNFIDFFNKDNKDYKDITNKILNQDCVYIPKNQQKNFIEDFKLYSPKNLSFVSNQVLKFIYFSSNVQKIIDFPYKLRYSSHVIPIFQKLFQAFLWTRSKDAQLTSLKRIQNKTDYLFVFIVFFAKLYPYSEYANLKTDLYIIRWLVQKKLPHFNDSLNRKNIGLQNLISEYLLHFFTNLSSQLTYRIWDFLIFTQQKDQARIIVAFTLLTYLEATDTLPIIPITQFMEKVQHNLKTISVDKEFAAKFTKISDTYFSNEKAKQERLLKHIRSSEDNGIIQDRVLKRIILGESKLKIPYQQQGKIPVARPKPFEKDKTLTIKELRYPLPEPNYFGFTIIEIILFIHDLNILENINLNTNKYWLRFSIPNTQWSQQIQIVQKSYFYNKSIRIPSGAINFFHIKEKQQKLAIKRHIMIQIVSKTVIKNQSKEKAQQNKELPKEKKEQEKEKKEILIEKMQLSGFIDYGLFQKDNAYKTCVSLTPDNSLHNKGRTILNLTICCKSHLYDSNKIGKKQFSSLQLLSQKLLDYDIGQGNECILALNKLSSVFQKIKYPLDEFSNDQYKRVSNRAISQYESDWLQSSITSIQQMKAIFYNLFSHQKDKSLRHEFSKFYQIFAQQHSMQYVYLAEMLVKFICIAQITRKKKLMYLYCVAVHYQNCYSKKINSETINSLIRLIFKQNTLINACPYSQNACGKIIQAYFFQSDLKSELKKDFTDIVQDWAYICNFKYGYSDIILGSSNDLSILRSFFDIKTLKRMQDQKGKNQRVQCRFEIIYEIEGHKYIWSATVNPKTFEIVKRGTKYLNNFSGYSKIQYLDSTQQFMLNCENVIPLQHHRSYSYQEFTDIMLSNHLVRYILDLPCLGLLPAKKDLKKEEKKEELKEVKIEEKKEEKKEVGKDEKEEKLKEFNNEIEQNVSLKFEKKEKKQQIKGSQSQFNSWGIFRGQNCLESWHKCKITAPGKVMSKVKFQFDKDGSHKGKDCNVATLDLISMDEIDLQSKKN